RRPRAARSAGIARARSMFALHAESERLGVPPEELLGERAEAPAGAAREEGGGPRRDLLRGGPALAAGAALAARPRQSLASGLSRPGAPRIAIVGAGLAGLR